MRSALLLLAACGDPISNRVLAADGEFRGARPSDARLESPAALRDSRLGTSGTLGDAQAAMTLVDLLTLGARASTNALLATTPAQRSDVLRAWEPIPAAAEIGDDTLLWWITAELVRADADADLDWTIQASGTKDGEYALIGEGRHDPAGTGTIEWDVGALGALVGVPASYDAITVTYDDTGAEDGGRDVTITGFRGEIPAETWALVTTAAFAWTGVFTVTDDAEPAPGYALAYAIAGVGGRAAGEITRVDQTTAWEACWDPAGDEVYFAGDADVTQVGVPGNCVLDAP